MRYSNQASSPKLPPALAWGLALGATLLLTSCSSTHITGARTAAGMAAPPFRNVMVAGLNDRPELRIQFEADMVAYLQQRKVVAMGSANQFAVSDFAEIGTDLRKRCTDAGAESLLVVRTTDRTSFENGPRAEHYTDYGYVETQVQLGATLYRLSDGATIWTGVVDTIFKEQYDSRVVLRKVADVIVNNLAKDRVIP